MKRLALLGASGHGKVVADAALIAGWQDIVFFDDAWPGLERNGHWPVVGDTAVLLTRIREFDGVLVSIGSCEARWRKQQSLQEAGAAIATVVHPRACVSAYARLGPGSVVMANAVVNVDAIIGDAAIVNTGATVDHDCVLGCGIHIGPGAHLSGNVTVGDCSWVGVGAIARQGTHIGSSVMVGAGAVVVSTVVDGSTVVGCPAKPISRG
ncbi:acetyltransferase [Ralstonia flaminis]|jgi:sugar O-acyltransferase (sialic acid O-acetyltransferase NeuD family)|uniref:Acetyltransferase EpsM n=1 Tax=Ralstonia flaminis TaxID=3058597 RepID=A0ABN9JE09_9RALS|nr:acetyltransferase [Ralstonia sp. LMG 18101]CAJ0808739.1 Putative acetyltransferase EpsM [Ralstonia sp. LMG 18101]